MTDSMVPVVGTPVWIDLASSDPAASRAFYAQLFGWTVEVNPDPQYGGYALARIGGRDVAGIGPKRLPEAPTAWSLYLGTTDVDGLAEKVRAAGGTVVAPPMQVGDQGRMAVFQDPSGAFISAWQPAAMGGFATGAARHLPLGGAELARHRQGGRVLRRRLRLGCPGDGRWARAGRRTSSSTLGESESPGGMEMNPMVPSRGAQLLDGLLRRGRRRRRVQAGASRPAPAR